MERLTASDKNYPELNRLQEMYMILVNRQLSNKYGNRDSDMSAGKLVGNDGDIEIEATRIVVLKELEKMLGTVQIANLQEVWGEFINSLKV